MIDNYISNHFNNIPGWVEGSIVNFLKHIAPLSSVGGVAEIGIYRGKFFYLLRCLLDSPEKSFALDIFNKQELNIDGSGGDNPGNFFQDNMINYDPFGGENINIITGDSFDNEIKNKIKSPIRFFSIDGGHTKLHILNDLKIAETTIANDGVVIVDDFLHPQWIGVTEGVFEYIRTNSLLIPFAVGHNKLYLCTPSYHKKYIENILFYPNKVKMIEINNKSVWYVS